MIDDYLSTVFKRAYYFRTIKEYFYYNNYHGDVDSQDKTIYQLLSSFSLADKSVIKWPNFS